MRQLILLFLVIPFATSAQKNYTASLDKYMNAQVSINEFSGNVLIAQKGKIIFEKAFGMADREWNISNTINSKFQIGSITKQFTAACVLNLVEQRKLSLDDKLSKYFPNFPKADSVTIHMLLTHTSGIKNYTEVPEFWKVATVPLEKDSMVALIANQPYEFSPDSKWNYSNSGYFLLGYIIEKVSGQTYSDYVLNSIIKKAGMENTFVNRWDTILKYRAKGYQKETTGWQNAMFISMEAPYSAGAIISTVGDLYKWNNALFSNKIISTASLTKMITPYMNHYGYGLGIDTFQHHLRIGHSGGIPGFLTYLGRFPKDSIVVVVLSNNSSNSPAIAAALAGILLDVPVVAPYKHKEVKIDSVILNQYIGKYVIGSSDTLEVIKKDGKLFRHKPDSDIELKPESNTKFFYADESDKQIEFKLDKSGKIVNTFFISGGIKEKMKRL